MNFEHSNKSSNHSEFMCSLICHVTVLLIKNSSLQNNWNMIKVYMLSISQLSLKKHCIIYLKLTSDKDILIIYLFIYQ